MLKIKVEIPRLLIIFFSIIIQNIIVETVTISSICLGMNHGCVSLSDKKVKCWGAKLSFGQSSDVSEYNSDMPIKIGDNLPYIDVGTNIYVESVSCEAYLTCMKLETGNVKCIGDNTAGQVGIGNSTLLVIGSYSGHIGDNLPIVNIGSGLKVVAVTHGLYHTCVKVTGNKVKCFGLNNYGQLGYGDVENRGMYLVDMSDNLPYVSLGTGVEIDTVHSGPFSYHNCVILSKPIASAQRLKCWGHNLKYQLGYGDTVNRGAELGSMGDNLALVDFGTESRVKKLALSTWYSCALLIDGKLKCYGTESNGQMALGYLGEISSTGNAMPSVLIDSGKAIAFITAGYQYTCIVYDDTITMKCFGYNNAGQLGQEDKTDRGLSPSTMISNISPIQLGVEPLQIASICSGYNFNCVVFFNSMMKCFGNGINEQLLNGYTQAVGDGLGEMGTNLQYSQIFTPTTSPSKAPAPPTRNPTNAPSPSPTLNPTKKPSKIPQSAPTIKPTLEPTKKPSKNPTKKPTFKPTKLPTIKPSKSPTMLCSYEKKKKCKKDSSCQWTNQGCSPL